MVKTSNIWTAVFLAMAIVLMLACFLFSWRAKVEVMKENQVFENARLFQYAVELYRIYCNENGLPPKDASALFEVGILDSKWVRNPYTGTNTKIRTIFGKRDDFLEGWRPRAVADEWLYGLGAGDFLYTVSDEINSSFYYGYYGIYAVRGETEKTNRDSGRFIYSYFDDGAVK